MMDFRLGSFGQILELMVYGPTVNGLGSDLPAVAPGRVALGVARQVRLIKLQKSVRRQ